MYRLFNTAAVLPLATRWPKHARRHSGQDPPTLGRHTWLYHDGAARSRREYIRIGGGTTLAYSRRGSLVSCLVEDEAWRALLPAVPQVRETLGAVGRLADHEASPQVAGAVLPGQWYGCLISMRRRGGCLARETYLSSDETGQLAALSSPGYGSMDGQPAVYLYIAALEVNVLNCR